MITEHNTRHGSVIERPEGWQYIGEFGRQVLNSIIKHDACNDNEKKAQILEAHKEAYSRKVGGITVIKLEA